jgi:hypothetical protein
VTGLQWISLNMERGASMHHKHGQGGFTLHKFPKMVKFQGKRHVFGLEMMGFFLQHDLRIMGNVFHGVNELRHLETFM